MRFLGGKSRKINCSDGKGNGMSWFGGVPVEKRISSAALLTKGVSSFGRNDGLFGFGYFFG
jgi:hypothetical protein